MFVSTVYKLTLLVLELDIIMSNEHYLTSLQDQKLSYPALCLALISVQSAEAL